MGKNCAKKCLNDPDNHSYQIGLNDPDNPDGVVTHLEPDILECEVKWSLGRITTKNYIKMVR